MQTFKTLRTAVAALAIGAGAMVVPPVVHADGKRDKVLNQARDECRKKMRKDEFRNIQLGRGDIQKGGDRVVFNAAGDRNGTNLSVSCVYNTRSERADID
jgi:hypothetical protein